MANSSRRLTRRRLLGTGAAAAGSLALGTSLASAASGTVGRRSLASAQNQQFKGKIQIGISQNPSDAAKEALNNAYKAVQPDVEIEWQTQTFQTANDYQTWIGTQLAAPDVNLDLVSANYAATYRGYLDLDQYVGTTNPYTGNPWNKDINVDFFRSVGSAGERTMLATRSVHINWFYNKDLFEKAGAEPPTTWDEFVGACEKLKAAGITPISANFDYQVPQWFSEIYFDQYHINWINEVRAQPTDWNYNPTLDGAFEFDPTDPFIHNKYTYNRQRFFKGIKEGTLRFDTPEVAALVENMAKVFPQYATSDFFVVADPYPAFLQQQVAIMPSGTWALGQLSNDLEALSPERLEQLKIDASSVATFNWGTFENPAMEGDLIQSPVRSVESATGEYVGILNRNQEQTNLSLDFMMFWLSPAGYAPYLEAQYQDPSWAPSGPLEVSGVQDEPKYQEMFDQVQLLGNAEVNYNSFFALGAGGDQIKDLRIMYQEALEGKTSPEDYAKNLQQYFTDNFDTVLDLSGLTMDDIDDPSRQPGS